MLSVLKGFTKKCSDFVAPPPPSSNRIMVYTPLEGIIIDTIDTDEKEIDLEANLQSVK